MSAFARAAEAHPPGVRLVRSRVDVFLDSLEAVDPESAADARAALADPAWPVNGLKRVLRSLADDLGVPDPPGNGAIDAWRQANG